MINSHQILYVYNISSTTKTGIPINFIYGFGLIPGVHYCLAKERIIFMQIQYLHCYHPGYSVITNHKDPVIWQRYGKNVIQSLGLSAGIYF